MYYKPGDKVDGLILILADERLHMDSLEVQIFGMETNQWTFRETKQDGVKKTEYTEVIPPKTKCWFNRELKPTKVKKYREDPIFVTNVHNHEKNETFLDCLTEIHKFKRGILRPGSYAFQFSFKVPEDARPSFEYEPYHKQDIKTHVFYMAKAILVNKRDEETYEA